MSNVIPVTLENQPDNQDFNVTHTLELTLKSMLEQMDLPEKDGLLKLTNYFSADGGEFEGEGKQPFSVQVRVQTVNKMHKFLFLSHMQTATSRAEGLEVILNRVYDQAITLFSDQRWETLQGEIMNVIRKYAWERFAEVSRVSLAENDKDKTLIIEP